MSDFIATNLFGQVPRSTSSADYPNGYGVPNPVPSGYSVGDGTLLLCPHSWTDTSAFIHEIWRSYQRDLYIKGTVTSPDQENWTGATSNFERTISVSAAENPSPVLPRPSTDILRGSVFPSTPGGVQDAVFASEVTIVSGISIGSFNEGINIAGGSNTTNLPVFLNIKAKMFFDFYPWYVDGGGGRTHYCNLDLIFSFEAYWDPDYTASPMPNLTFYPWITHTEGYTSSDLRGTTSAGKLWSAGSAGATSTIPAATTELGIFGMREQISSTEPIVNSVSWEKIELFTSSTYYPRPSL